MKRNKTNRSDTRDLSLRAESKMLRDLKAVEEVPGDGEVSPLCIAVDGTRAWARQRVKPYSIIYLDFDDPSKTWHPTKDPLSAGG